MTTLKKKQFVKKKPNKVTTKLSLKNLYFFNILLTKTNSFCSITTYKFGNTLFLETPRKHGFQTTTRRKDYALEAILQHIVKKFFLKFDKKTSKFIIQIFGRKFRKTKKIIRFLLRRLRLKRQIIYILLKQIVPHNGCKHQIKKRKKRRKKQKKIL